MYERKWHPFGRHIVQFKLAYPAPYCTGLFELYGLRHKCAFGSCFWLEVLAEKMIRVIFFNHQGVISLNHCMNVRSC